jgi:hypothetical protein
VAMAARRLSSLLSRSLSASRSASLLSFPGDLFHPALLDGFSSFFILDNYDGDDVDDLFLSSFSHPLMFLGTSDTIFVSS